MRKAKKDKAFMLELCELLERHNFDEEEGLSEVLATTMAESLDDLRTAMSAERERQLNWLQQVGHFG